MTFVWLIPAGLILLTPLLESGLARYTTMDSRYAATVLRVFGKFVNDGYVDRKEKTVPWCPSCQVSSTNG